MPRLSYAIRIWGEALRKKTVCRALIKVQRIFVTKISRSFKTCGTKEATSIALVTPIDGKLKIIFNGKMQAEVKTQLYGDNLNIGDSNNTNILAQIPLFHRTKFKFNYDAYQHFPVNILYVLTQALTGHGRHNYYIAKLNSETSPFCTNDRCSEMETIDHIIFRCPTYNAQRRFLCRTSRDNNIQFTDINNLVNNKITLNALINFLQQTKLRLPTTVK